jgi:hypothetical protein
VKNKLAEVEKNHLRQAICQQAQSDEYPGVKNRRHFVEGEVCKMATGELLQLTS